MGTALTTHDEALHTMAMDDVAELVAPGDEQRVPERIRGEVIARHGGSPADDGATSSHVGTPYKNHPKEAKVKSQWCKYELTPEREAVIRERWDGKTSTIRAIGEQIGVPWYTVRDWGQDKLHLPNPSTMHPKGAGNLEKPKKHAAPSEKPAQTAAADTPKTHGKIPWSAEPDEHELSEIEEKRAERNAMIAKANADDVIRADRVTGWLTPKWGDYTDEMGQLISAQWDGSDASLQQLTERERMPLGVLRGWIEEHHLKPTAPRATPAQSHQLEAVPQMPRTFVETVTSLPSATATPRPLPSVTPLPETLPRDPGASSPGASSQTSVDRRDARLDHFAAWLDGTVGGDLSVFLLPAPAEVLVLRGPGGYRVLTPRGDWPDEPLSRRVVECIVRLLASGASDAAVHGVVYQAEA